MAQTRLRRLRLKGLRSFSEQSEVEFPESGMMLVRGKNLDSGGSSGSGKSSLLLAISYLLGFCRFPATALQTWLTEEPLNVEGTFDVKDGELIISRGQKLELTLNGKEVKGSAKQLEEKINKYIGLAPDLLSALTYRGQKQPGLFLSKTDSQKKEFLTLLLDLSRFEVEYETSQGRSRQLQADFDAQKFLVDKLGLDLIKARSSFTPALVSDEKALQGQLDLATKHSDRLREQVQVIRNGVKAFEMKVEEGALKLRRDAEPRLTELEVRVKTLAASKPDLASIDSSAMMYVEADLKQAREFCLTEEMLERDRQRARQKHSESVHTQLILIEKRLAAKPGLEKRLGSLREQIAELDNSSCPTCKRQWEDADLKAQELVAELALAVHEYDSIGDPRPEIERLQDEFKSIKVWEPGPEVIELKTIVETLEKQLAEENARYNLAVAMAGKDLQSKAAEARSELERARAGTNDMITRYRGNELERIQDEQMKLETLDREIQMSDNQAGGIRAALNRVQIDNARERERALQLEAQINRLQVDLDANNLKQHEINTNLSAELDFQKLCGREGFLGTIFDEVLWEISEETNRLLAMFPNTAHVTLYFRSESISQKGSIKKEIRPVVSIGGFEAPLVSGLSGGMETAVELAVDLAVATVVSRRTGAMPSWLILDESFTGLGPCESEASMEILKAFSTDRLVLVVDHASELKSLFTQFIDVEYSGGFSKAKGATS